MRGINEFLESMAARGLHCPDLVVPDGKIHRFHVAGDRQKSRNGWYVFYGDDGLPAGAFGSWKLGETFNWCGKSEKSLSDADQAKLREQIAKTKKARDQELKRFHAEARKKAYEVWKQAKPVTEHPYLAAKGVKPHGLRQHQDLLIVPVLNTKGIIHSLQSINSNGDKLFLPDGAIRGHFFSIDGDGDTLLVCEGYSTAATLHEATGYPVVCAMNCGNLKAVCKVLHRKSPGTKLVVCGDDDYQTDGNPGLTKAKEAAEAVRAVLVVPKFKDQTHRGTDFNDLHQIEGLEAVRRQIEDALRIPTSQVETPDDPGETDANTELWETAKELFPRIEFPEILPRGLSDSLAQLARSIGMSARSLFGICIAAVGAAIGDRISVSPKKSWCEPLIFWLFDIRPSGEGKTPGMQALIKSFHRKEKIEHDYYDLKKAEFDGLSAKERRKTVPPPDPKGYISNVLTVEGLRKDLENSKTGGTLIALTEASALISGQNEYKSKGGDRSGSLDNITRR